MTTDIPGLVVAAGGELVGKVRLQKTVYLLDQIGLNSGFTYEYHHYGPYSEDLSEQVEDDVVFGRIAAEPRRRMSDGVPYIVYRADKAGVGDTTDRYLTEGQLHAALGEMKRCSATILELAATMHWLSEAEGIADWKAELIRRKGSKVSGDRDQRALKLLAVLELPPAAS